MPKSDSFESLDIVQKSVHTFLKPLGSARRAERITA